MNILVVEDEEKIANFLRRGLMEESYGIDIAKTGEEALYKFEINSYDCIILDIMIPDGDGVFVCRKVREKNASIPILILSALNSIETKVSAFDAGADDYLTKPFAFSELSVRIRALIRRGQRADPIILKVDTLLLNPATRIAKRGSKSIYLTTREYALLEYFMRHANRVITKTEILEHVWDYNYNGLSNIVETYVKYLRKKIQTTSQDKELIHTLRGTGYILRSDE